MGKITLPSTRKKVYINTLIPLGTVMLIALIMGKSVLLGGLIWFIPQIYVAYRLFHKIETEPAQFLRVFYRSEIVKLTLVALLFILVVKWISVSLLGLIGGYLCAQSIFWLLSVMSER